MPRRSSQSRKFFHCPFGMAFAYLLFQYQHGTNTNSALGSSVHKVFILVRSSGIADASAASSLTTCIVIALPVIWSPSCFRSNSLNWLSGYSSIRAWITLTQVCNRISKSCRSSLFCWCLPPPCQQGAWNSLLEPFETYRKHFGSLGCDGARQHHRFAVRQPVTSRLAVQGRAKYTQLTSA